VIALVIGALALLGLARAVVLAKRALVATLASMRALVKRAFKRRPRAPKGQSADLAKAIAMLAYAIAAQNGQAKQGRLP